MKHKSIQPAVITREEPPKVQQTPNGARMICPYCTPPHVLIPGQQSACGTTLKVSAVQIIIPARTANEKKLRCLKCGEVGRAPMVQCGGGYVHRHDCKPGTQVLPAPPPYSAKAERVYNMKAGWMKEFLEKRYGRAQCVKEVNVDGVETGNILSYFFLKEANHDRRSSEGKHPAVDTDQPVS